MRLYKNNIPNPPTPTTANVAQPTCILPPPPVNGIAVVFVVFVVFGEEKEVVVLGMAYGGGGCGVGTAAVEY